MQAETGVLRIRGTFEDAFGQGKAPIFLGLDPKMGKLKPLVLMRYAREAIEVLSNPDLVIPEPVVAGLWDTPSRSVPPSSPSRPFSTRSTPRRGRSRWRSRRRPSSWKS